MYQCYEISVRLCISCHTIKLETATVVSSSCCENGWGFLLNEEAAVVGEVQA